jgi:hypothetical protein
MVDVGALKGFSFTGHSARLGKRERPWQDTEYVLALFGRTVSGARRNLQRLAAKWAAKGRCPELTGGWRAVKKAYRDRIRLASDGRILGSSKFVEATQKGAGERYDRSCRSNRPVSIYLR